METPFDRWIAGWRAPAFAGLIALLAGLPGLAALPVLDRDEARFAQATAQMIEDGDYTAIRFQQNLRGGAAPGAHWLQAASVQAFSAVEAREIWAWRIPSLLGLVLAAIACAWGAAAQFGQRAGLLAGGLLAVSFLGSSLAGMATSDALFLAASALVVSAFGKIYQAAEAQEASRWRHRALFWGGVILGVLVKGPLVLALVVLAGAALYAFDRRAPWLKSLGWGWGLIALAAIAGPWIVAVTVATDGTFWREPPARGAAFGLQTLATPLLFFPGAGLLALGAVYAWRARNLAGVRLAAAWLLPAWLLFELLPDKAVHDASPLYIALAWLCAAAFEAHGQDRPLGRSTRLVGAVLSLASALVLAGASLWLAHRFGAAGGRRAGMLTASLFAVAGMVGAWSVLAPSRWRTLALAGATGAVAHAALAAALLPALPSLWPSREAEMALTAAGLSPREGLAVGPVATVGYAEPSLVFRLGGETEVDTPQAAVVAIAQGRPALVEARQDAAFRAEASRRGVRAEAVTSVDGLPWSLGERVKLILYQKAGS